LLGPRGGTITIHRNDYKRFRNTYGVRLCSFGPDHKRGPPLTANRPPSACRTGWRKFTRQFWSVQGRLVGEATPKTLITVPMVIVPPRAPKNRPKVPPGTPPGTAPQSPTTRQHYISLFCDFCLFFFNDLMEKQRFPTMTMFLPGGGTIVNHRNDYKRYRSTRQFCSVQGRPVGEATG
jgi:hypothetical protein